MQKIEVNGNFQEKSPVKSKIVCCSQSEKKEKKELGRTKGQREHERAVRNKERGGGQKKRRSRNVEYIISLKRKIRNVE